MSHWLTGKASMTDLAANNILRNLPAVQAQKFHPCHGCLDGAEWIKNMDLFDGAFGCLPRIAARREKDSPPLHAATQYDRDHYASDLHQLGLGLHDVVLQQLHKIIKPNGHAIFLFDRSCGLDTLLKLYEDNGFQPRILHQEVHRLHPHATLEDCTYLEHLHKHHFEFFEDPEARHMIDAQTATQRRASFRPVYHYLTILDGRKMMHSSPESSRPSLPSRTDSCLAPLSTDTIQHLEHLFSTKTCC